MLILIGGLLVVSFLYFVSVIKKDDFDKKLEDIPQTLPSSTSSSSFPEEGSNMECSQSVNPKYVCSKCGSRPQAIKIEESTIITTTTTTTREEVIEESYESSLLRYYNDENSTMRSRVVPFPEAGVDIVDRKLKNTEDTFEREIDKEYNDDILTYTESWTENWLFRKKDDEKSKENEVSFKPVPMFIPMTNTKYRAMIGDKDVDEISDLSDCDDDDDDGDEDEKFADNDEEKTKRRKVENGVHAKYIYGSNARLLLDTKSKHHRTLEHEEIQFNNNRDEEKKENFDFSEIGNSRSYRSELFIETNSGVNQNSVAVAAAAVADDDNKLLSDIDFNLFSPPKPGTIADREHRKWQTAVPMENNPYSEANLQRRLLERNYTPKYTSLLGSARVRINGFDDGVAVADTTMISDIDFDTIDYIPENIDNSEAKLPEKKSKTNGEINDESENKSKRTTSSSSNNSQAIVKLTKKNATINEVDCEEEEEEFTLPSVKKLVEVFSSYQCNKGSVQLPPIPSPRKSKDKNNTNEKVIEFVKVERTTRPPHLHSLTARSLSKEFREGLR